MNVYVIQDSEGDVVGVVSDKHSIKTGRSKGLQTHKFVLDGMQEVGKHDRPWVVYFKDADEDRPQVWPIIGGFPEESGPCVYPEGIEFCVYATNAGEAAEKICSRLHYLWDKAVANWKEMQ